MGARAQVVFLIVLENDRVSDLLRSLVAPSRRALSVFGSNCDGIA